MLFTAYRCVLCLRVALAGCLLLLTACDTVDPGLFEVNYVVESYQIAGERLQPVRLSRTAPVDAEYVREAQAVRQALVQIHALGADGRIEKSYRLHETPGSPGLYASDSEDRVQPLQQYQLEVTFPDREDRIRSTTQVPDTLRLINLSADSLRYRDDRQFEVTITRSSYPGRQNIYVFTCEAMDLRPEGLTPIARHLYEQHEVTLDQLRMNQSPPLNESNYVPNPDGTITLPMPWLMVLFYGPQRITANVIDDNMYDFVRSINIQQGGSTLPPGEIPNVIDHVEGGTGVFGSFARAVIEVYVLPPASATGN
jgi:hypothetical protein